MHEHVVQFMQLYNYVCPIVYVFRSLGIHFIISLYAHVMSDFIGTEIIF